MSGGTTTLGHQQEPVVPVLAMSSFRKPIGPRGMQPLWGTLLHPSSTSSSRSRILPTPEAVAPPPPAPPVYLHYLLRRGRNTCIPLTSSSTFVHHDSIEKEEDEEKTHRISQSCRRRRRCQQCHGKGYGNGGECHHNFYDVVSTCRDIEKGAPRGRNTAATDFDDADDQEELLVPPPPPEEKEDPLAPFFISNPLDCDTAMFTTVMRKMRSVSPLFRFASWEVLKGLFDRAQVMLVCCVAPPPPNTNYTTNTTNHNTTVFEFQPPSGSIYYITPAYHSELPVITSGWQKFSDFLQRGLILKSTSASTSSPSRSRLASKRQQRNHITSVSSSAVLLSENPRNRNDTRVKIAPRQGGGGGGSATTFPPPPPHTPSFTPLLSLSMRPTTMSTPRIFRTTSPSSHSQADSCPCVEVQRGEVVPISSTPAHMVHDTAVNPLVPPSQRSTTTNGGDVFSAPLLCRSGSAFWAMSPKAYRELSDLQEAATAPKTAP